MTNNLKAEEGIMVLLKPMKIVSTINGHELVLEATFLGKDISVLIYGGDEHHIGGIALAYPTRSHYRDATTISVSTITAPGHKDYVVANSAAEKISKSLNTTVTVSVGIHVDNASKEMIQQILDSVESMTDEFLSSYQKAE